MCHRELKDRERVPAGVGLIDALRGLLAGDGDGHTGNGKREDRRDGRRWSRGEGVRRVEGDADGRDPDEDGGEADARERDPLREYADRWEETDRGMGRYVVYPPEDGPSSVRRCQTLDEVRRRLDHWYG